MCLIGRVKKPSYKKSRIFASMGRKLHDLFEHWLASHPIHRLERFVCACTRRQKRQKVADCPGIDGAPCQGKVAGLGRWRYGDLFLSGRGGRSDAGDWRRNEETAPPTG